jgi:hypothetical protein
MTFFNATRSKNAYAVSCWFVSVIIEVIILILVARDHQDYEYTD